MEDVDRRSAFVLGLAAASAFLFAGSEVAEAEVGDETEVAKGVKVKFLGEGPAMVPGAGHRSGPTRNSLINLEIPSCQRRTGQRGALAGGPSAVRAVTTVERERIENEAKVKAFADLTEEQIQAITPREMFRLVALAAIRSQDIPFILKSAEAWAPYEMPRLASEVHRVFTDDSKRSEDDISAELADLRRH